MNEQELQQLLVVYLRINNSPTDEQFHNLADAVGTDKETLEAIAYKMLAETDEVEGIPTVHATSTHSEVGFEMCEDDCDDPYLLIEAEVDAPGDAPQSEQQDVLQGDYDPFTTSTDDLALNDGAPMGTSSIEENQDATLDDGVASDDTGIGVSSDQSSVYNDGLAPVQFAALARLRETE